MSSLATVYDLVVAGGLFAATLATLGCAYRVVTGPTVPDRVVALDAVGTCVVAIVVLHALDVGRGFFVLVAVMLAIVGFVTTVVAAKYLTEGDVIE